MTDMTSTATMRAPSFSLFAALHAWNKVRATRRALSALSDRELDDIGLCRADINTISAGQTR